MAGEPTIEEQTTQLRKQTDLLTQELALLKAQIGLDSAKQAQDAQLLKALLDTLKEQAASQYSLGVAQAQLPFAELQGIKAGISGLTLPKGKEGTVKVSAGTPGTALLRSKNPLLVLLDEVADELISICPEGGALLTEAQLAQAYSAQFNLKRIDDEKAKLADAVQKAAPVGPGTKVLIPGAAAVAAGIAGAYTIGLALDTINSLIKLLRTDRQLDVFGADAEAAQVLGYLLQSKREDFVVNPATLGDKVLTEADTLMNKLRELENQLQVGNETLGRIKKYSDDIAKAPANDPIKQTKMPTDEAIAFLKAEIELTRSLLDGLDPGKKPEAFWTQVTGQLLWEKIKQKKRLLVETKAQTVQVTESKWYRPDRILATGEVQIAYRCFNADGSLNKAGIILKASDTKKARIDKLRELAWPPKPEDKMLQTPPGQAR